MNLSRGSISFFLYRQEINIIFMKNAVLSSIAALDFSSAPVATLLSAITLVLTGQSLTPVNVFMLLSFISLLQNCFCRTIAFSVLQTYDAYASLQRLEEFLCLENLPSAYRDKRSQTTGRISKLHTRHGSKTIQEVSLLDNVKDLKKSTALCVSSLTKKQIKREDEFILQDIEITAETGSLIVITGPVGSGKSTLLSAIAGEVSDTTGTVSYIGRLVYVPQLAWVFSGTIRENILFGESYNESKYTRIIEACALTKDIQKFPGFDKTVVGERGETLSGGQRARVSLARAVYADADLYLLDDPLSAVDFKVGHHIFQQCIKGLLGQKTRVVTSHQEQVLKEADSIVVLYKGRVMAKGSFTELKEKGFLNTIIDPLFKKVNEKKSDESFLLETGEKNEDADNSEGIDHLVVNPASEFKSLKISEEDRAIGAVSSKLYWNYFRSGVPVLVIIAVLFLYLITQGKPLKIFLILKLFLCQQTCIGHVQDKEKTKRNLSLLFAVASNL